MELRDIIPIKEVHDYFGQQLQSVEYGLTDLPEIVRVEPLDIIGTSLNVWNRVVQNKLRPVDPLALASWIQSADPLIYQQIEKLIGARVFTDVAYFSGKLGNETAALVSLFRVFPNCLHLTDVVFQDPRAPLPRAEQKTMRKYRGLGLLPRLMSGMKTFAAENGVEFLTLTAAHLDLVPLFEKHGFTVEDNQMSKWCYERGRCIPMEFKVQ